MRWYMHKKFQFSAMNFGIGIEKERLFQYNTVCTHKAETTLAEVREYSMKQDKTKNELFEKVKSISQNATKSVVNIVSDIAESTCDMAASTIDKVNAAIEEKKAAAEKDRKDKFDAAILPLEGTETGAFIRALGDSPLKLTDNKAKQIKNVFPIPREQNILWADAEFDLRPSGIVATDKGLFIRTNVSMLDGKIGVSNFILNSFESEEQQAYLLHKNQYHSGKAVLLFYSWSDFDTRWFVSESEIENKALLVEPQCSRRFIELCRMFSMQIAAENSVSIDMDEAPTNFDEQVIQTSIAAGAAVESSQIAIFAEHKASINTPAGHGEMAEEAINMLDRLHGFDAKIIGRDNAKDGADRQVGDIFIQTKYYNSARGSLEACFNPETGQYRYMKDGKPMQLEVPKDQYQKVLDGFRRKIEKGKVPGVTDPNEAVNIVRKGRLTYQQVVNLTEPGTIESLSYDAHTGVVTCSCALGITFVVTVFLIWRKTGDIKQAIQAGASAGLQVFGISFVQHMLVSQIARTGLANSLLAPSQFVVGKLGYQASATIVNGIRALSGKSALYGAAASKHLAKILRSNALTSVLSFAAFSIPETYNAAAQKISVAQYAKNMSVLAGSIVASAGGAIAAGVVAAKVAGAAGTAVTPGVGTVVGIAGGFVGGAVGAKVVQTTGDILHEDDVETLSRLFNAYVSSLIGEYLLDEAEIDCLTSRLNEIKQKELKLLFENLKKAKEQERVVRDFLNPYFKAIVIQREQFMLPSPDCIIEALVELVEEDIEVLADGR